ncbi:MAG: His/Gly/Thr/Pro-type tRNA ligase C-terminal domain-containing protein, partial [Alphaproteobacteria bacterium]
KAANIRFQDRDGGWQHPHTTSWGASTRLVGALVMTHGDDNGLQLPPRIAPSQIVILPIIRDEAQRGPVLDYAERLAAQLRAQSHAGTPVRVRMDTRDLPPPEKKWEWVRKGVPLLIEVGPRDIEGEAAALMRRDRIDEKKAILPLAELVAKVPDMLGEIQSNLFEAARAERDRRMRTDITDYETLAEYFRDMEADTGFSHGFVRAWWCEDAESEEKLAELGVSVRCIPFDQPEGGGACVLTGKPAKRQAIFGKAY